MKIGFLGFGKTGKEASLAFLEDPDVQVAWVVKKNRDLQGTYASQYHYLKKKQGIIVRADDIDTS